MEKDLKDNSNAVINTRTVLWIMVFLGFGVNFMMRVNINIAIVDMIKDRSDIVGFYKNETVPKCIDRRNIDSNSTDLDVDINVFQLFENRTRNKFYSIERELLDILNINYDKSGFDWNEHKQGLIFGSFFWMHMLTQIPGGIWSRKYGAKLIFGLSNFIGCGLCFFMPIAAYFDYRGIIVLRVLQGLAAVSSFFKYIFYTNLN